MTFRRFTKRATLMSLFLGILLVGSVAFAWWTASGTGQGYAKAETLVAIDTLDVSGIVTADLHPGGTGDVLIRIRNQNTFPVDVTNIAATSAPYTTPTDAACDASGSVTWVADQAGTWTVPAAGTLDVTLANNVAMDGPSAVDACQGEVFAIDVALTATSA
jgi:hypothetical protein